jgi:hypothetical protein
MSRTLALDGIALREPRPKRDRRIFLVAARVREVTPPSADDIVRKLSQRECFTLNRPFTLRATSVTPERKTGRVGSSPLLLGAVLLLCLGGALTLTLRNHPSRAAATPPTHAFSDQGWLQPNPPPSFTSSAVTLHWTSYPAARWCDATVLTEDPSVVHRAFVRETTELTVPRSALPRSKLLWQVTVQPKQGARVDSSAFFLDLVDTGG